MKNRHVTSRWDDLALAVIAVYGLASFAVGAACKTAPPSPPEPDVVVVPPLTTSDAGEDPPDQPDGAYADPACAKACKHLRDLGCSDGTTRPGEDSCYVVCKRADQSGKIDLHLACVIGKPDVAGVRACGSYRCK